MTPTRETIARAISGAPFPTGRSLGKADAVLRALDAAGLAVVPKEATADMVHAATVRPNSDRALYAAIYRAMIAAAPDAG